MSVMGFMLTSLTLTGPDVAKAEIHFTSGLNVVVGASNTGKTFIAQCIDFLFGAGRAPKEIPETASYESIWLGLRSTDGEHEMVLERSLRGGDVRVHMGGQEPRTLSARHQSGKQDTVSHFLLALSGLAGKKIRTNQQGETRLLSFRDIAGLVLVDEEGIISERSPIFSGQYTKRTEESTVFRLLLTGIDDSSVIAKDHPKIVKGRNEGRSEVIETLAQRMREQLGALQLEGDATTARTHFELADALFEDASASLATEQQSIASVEGRRRDAWTRLRQVESRMAVLTELQGRFELLQEQYLSDLRRLESIAEASLRLGQMKEERCPVCGAPAEHHDKAHQEGHAAPDDVAAGCRAEAHKIRALLSGLQTTVGENNAHLARLQEEHHGQRALLDAAGDELTQWLQPRTRAALERLRVSQSQRDIYRRAVDLYERVEELEGMLGEGGNSKKATAAEGPPIAVGADEAEQFSKQVETLLRAWQFPNLDRVTFSERDQDVVITGQQRASHGKGVRAITHAAFNLALLRYCRSRALPHPGVVIIDSPLIVYRQPDEGEHVFAGDVKDAFYRSLAATFRDSQVIILENDVPPSELDPSVNIIEFTGAAHGRRGFIPANP